jgi:hypothetical protein
MTMSARDAFEYTAEYEDPRNYDWASMEEDSHFDSLQIVAEHDDLDPTARVMQFKRDRVPSRSNDVARLFDALFEAWTEETMFSSAVDEIVLNKNYQRIIGLGPKALPYLLDRLQHSDAHLFWALEHISGENPVPEELWGNVPEMSARWLQWGVDRGLIANAKTEPQRID